MQTRKPFHKFRCVDMQFSEVYWDKDMPYFTRRAIGTALGYPDPEDAVDNISKKVPGFPIQLEIETTNHSGKKCKEKLYDLSGVLLISSHANTRMAEHVIFTAWGLLNLWVSGELSKIAKLHPTHV